MLKRLLESFYPSVCVLCGNPGQSHRPICAACETDLPQNATACVCCAYPLPAESEGSLCGRCLQRRPRYDSAWSPFLYAQPLEWMIHQFKFNAKLYFGPLIADLMISRLPEKTGRAECIIPVPLHPRRFRQRGFNQSMELARPIGKALSIPVDHRSCHKILYTEAQTGKNARQRRRNVKGVFHFENKAAYRHVIVLDDVVTTGSTVAEITRVLKRQGVMRVDVWSVARAPLD